VRKHNKPRARVAHARLVGALKMQDMISIAGHAKAKQKNISEAANV